MTTRWRTIALTATFAAFAAVAACSGSDGGTNSTSGSGGDASGGGVSEGGSAEGGSGTGTATGMTDPCEGVSCPDGEVCDGGTCVMGCIVAEDCGMGESCCDGACIDVSSNVDHCGQCGKPCADLENQTVTCQMGICSVGACEMGYYDCDGAPGCEADAMCSCTPGETQPCYPGPAGTEANAPCQAGTRKCNAAGTAWGLCEGFVLPEPEVCANNVDEDCNGTADDVPDIDGDGWTACDNDCCETTQDCGSPASVNPGAFEFVGNMVDDDCDPATSDSVVVPACSTAADFTNVSGMEMAQAMDLCQTTTANAPLPTKKWGVISADLVFADGTTPNGSQLNTIRNSQIAVLTDYGTGGVLPQNGPTMAGMSSGWMRDANDPNSPGTPSTSFGHAHQPPASYLAAHGGNLPASQGCSGGCPSGSGANDSVNLRLQIRVPTNAQSFSYDFRFFSLEYWTWQCTVYNDFYLALLQTGAGGIPADGNISFDSLSNPVSVNNGFFDHCSPKTCNTCPLGIGALNGTTMDQPNGVGGVIGGGTTWLTTTAPIVPGETMTLELMVFDVSDGVLDSLTLLDNFEWSLNPSGVGTGPAG